MNWYLTDEQDRQYSISVFTALGQREILIPSLWIYEVSNVLIEAQRRSRISEERIQYILETLIGFNLLIDKVVPESALRLSRLAMQYDLTVYDAAYLDLAMRSDTPIAMNDKALLKAMRAANVHLVNP
jgi:predicted nucleic acid-binding protein